LTVCGGRFNGLGKDLDHPTQQLHRIGAAQQTNQYVLHGAQSVCHLDLPGMGIVVAAIVNDLLSGAGQHVQVQGQSFGMEILE